MPPEKANGDALSAALSGESVPFLVLDPATTGYSEKDRKMTREEEVAWVRRQQGLRARWRRRQRKYGVGRFRELSRRTRWETVAAGRSDGDEHNLEGYRKRAKVKVYHLRLHSLHRYRGSASLLPMTCSASAGSALAVYSSSPYSSICCQGHMKFYLSLGIEMFGDGLALIMDS